MRASAPSQRRRPFHAPPFLKAAERTVHISTHLRQLALQIHVKLNRYVVSADLLRTHHADDKATPNNKRIFCQAPHFVMARLVRATFRGMCGNRWPGQAVP